MAPTPRAVTARAPAGGAAIGVGIGVGLGVGLFILIVIGIVVWLFQRKKEHRWGRIAQEIPSSSPKTDPLPPYKHRRHSSDQSVSERRGLLRLSSDGPLPIWEQRHTLPPVDETPFGTHDWSSSYAEPPESPSTRNDPRRVNFRLPNESHFVDPFVETPRRSRVGSHGSHESHGSMSQAGQWATRDPKRDSMTPSSSSGTKDQRRASMPSPGASSVRSGQWIDLSLRPDLLPPSFLPVTNSASATPSHNSATPSHNSPTASQPERPQAASGSPSSMTRPQDPTAAAGLGRFSNDWRERFVETRSHRAPASIAALPPAAHPGSVGGRSPIDPVSMQQVRDDGSFRSDEDEAARLRLQSFASATGSLSTTRMSSEGAIDLRRQLRASLQFPVAHPLAGPKMVEGGQPGPALAIPAAYISPPQSLAASVEGPTRTRSTRRQTWQGGHGYSQSADSAHGDMGLGGWDEVVDGGLARHSHHSTRGSP